MQLISYVKTATNKWLLIFESHSDLNRCAPYRGNLIHMTHTLPMPLHVCHSYASCGRGPYVATFHAYSTKLDRFTAPKKKYSWLHLSAQLSGPWDLPQFSPNHNHWNSALKPNICWWTCYIGLLGPYHQYVISTFNICSRGPTHRSLTDIGWGYNLGGDGLLHHIPQPSQPTILYFPPKGPTRSQVIHPSITNWSKEETNSTSREWEPPLDFCNLSCKHNMS
jgi:hypothetical protein